MVGHSSTTPEMGFLRKRCRVAPQRGTRDATSIFHPYLGCCREIFGTAASGCGLARDRDPYSDISSHAAQNIVNQ